MAVRERKYGNEWPICAVDKGYLKNSDNALCEVGLIKMKRIWGLVTKTIFQVASAHCKGYLKNIVALQVASLVD